MVRLNASLISILLITASLYSPSHCLILDGLTIGEAAIMGIARCSLTGELTAPPISNGTVILTCAGLTNNLAETLSSPGGYFLIFLSFLQTLLFTPSVCDIRLTLPTGNCTISSPNGTLSGALTLVSVAVTNNTNIVYYAVGPITSNILG